MGLSITQCRRFYCAKILDARHGTFTARFSPQHDGPYAGQVQSWMRCNCWKKPASTQPSTLRAVLTLKHEELVLAAASFARYVLYSTFNPPLQIEPNPGCFGYPGSVHGATLLYHSQESYGPYQRLHLVINRQLDGGFTIRNPIPLANRMQLKWCVMC